jgi:HEPN domain-containing protein
MVRSHDWMRQSERDLEKSRLDLEHAYFDWACFTAHQAAEKAVKALHQSRNRSVRGHGLVQLLTSLKEDPAAPEEVLHAGRVLDRYYIEARYPNGFSDGAPVDHFDQKLAQEAVDAADGIVRFCRRHLG